MIKYSSVSAVLAVLLFSACGRHASSPEATELPRVAVQVGSVQETGSVRTQVVTGTVLPQARAVVAAKVMGSVTSADFAVGQRVEAGTLLVKLAAAEIGARLDQAQAALNQARRDFEREAALLEKGASTSEAVRNYDERRRIAESAVAEARSMLGYTEIKAPFAGVITRRLVSEGDLASPGTPLFAIEGTDHLRAEVQVPESLPAATLGAKIVVQGDDALIDGMLAEYSPAADPQSRTREAKVDLPAGATVRSGQFIRVLWPAGDSQALTVPVEAVSLFGQMERVFAVSDGKAHLRLVKTGARSGGRVEILSGLVAGESVVLAPPATFRDGQPVEVRP